jgi:uncharacterized protein YceK
MKRKKSIHYTLYIGLILILNLVSGCKTVSSKNQQHTNNLVASNTWYVTGPVLESQETINSIRKKEGVIRLTARNNPVGEIELNVMVTPSESNDGPATNLANTSTFVSITYKSSHLIKLQAREGNDSGTGCIHGGSHPRIDLPASPDAFTTAQIPWSDFKQDGIPEGKRLNIHNLCKFNFVNYFPVSGAKLEITAVRIEH